MILAANEKEWLPKSEDPIYTMWHNYETLENWMQETILSKKRTEISVQKHKWFGKTLL